MIPKMEEDEEEKEVQQDPLDEAEELMGEKEIEDKEDDE